MNGLYQDLQYGLRMLARSPGFTAVAVLTLALGIGATTAIFSFVNGVVLRPLPYRESDKLVMVLPATRTSGTFSVITVSPGDFLEWQSQNHVFDEMAAFGGWSAPSLTDGGEPQAVAAASVTSRFFETLGVTPLIGRTFRSHEQQPDAKPSEFGRMAIPNQVVMISAALWQRQFGSNPAVVGKSITLDDQPATIVGVAPPGFTFPQDLYTTMGARFTRDIELWTLLVPEPGYRANATLQVVARLKPDVSIDRARADMTTIAQRLERQFARDRATGLGVNIMTVQERVVRGVRPLLLLFLGAVGFLLLIACTNVANLLLGRTTARQKEVAIRSALGSGRSRLVRQFLTESVLLGLLGGLSGLLVAVWAMDLASRLLPPGSLPRLAEVSIDPQVLAFTFLVSFVTGLAFGVVPALQSSRADVTTALRESAQTHTGGSRFLSLLVVSEVALAFVLLVGAGLLIKSFARLTSVDPGFKPERVLTLSVVLPEAGYDTPARMRAFSTEVLEPLQNAPGVLHAGAVNWLPLGGNFVMGDFTAEGVPQLPRGLMVMKPAVSAEYFQAMGIPLMRSRSFTGRDTERAPGVAIVTDGLARQLWPGQDALGKRLKLGFGRPEEEPWLTVVGVAGDVKQTGLGDQTRPAIYVPLLQAPRPFLLRNQTFVVRAAGDPSSVASLMRREIRDVDPTLPLGRVRTMEERLANSVSEPRFRSIVLGGFASAALALVAIGILGVLAYAVTRRTREIGVRMALGAQRVDVLRLVVRHALGMTLIGVTAGLIGAIALTRLLTSYLFEVRPTDPVTFVAASFVLVAVSLVASYVPARRATKVDPLIALRSE